MSPSDPTEILDWSANPGAGPGSGDIRQLRPATPSADGNMAIDIDVVLSRHSQDVDARLIASPSMPPVRQSRRSSPYRQEDHTTWKKDFTSINISEEYEKFDEGPDIASMRRLTRLRRLVLFTILLPLACWAVYARCYHSPLKVTKADDLGTSQSSMPEGHGYIQLKPLTGHDIATQQRLMTEKSRKVLKAAMDREEETRQRLIAEKIESDMIAQIIAQGPSGSLSAHQTADFADVVLIKDLDSRLVPEVGGGSKSMEGRLIVVGDVHGMKKELVKLLEKLVFDSKRDHLILAGDMISKGPDSVGVIKLAMEMRASAVRGNHEDRVLLAHASMRRKHNHKAPQALAGNAPMSEEDLATAEMLSHSGEYKDRKLAKQFNQKQIKWMKDLPVILRVGDIEGMGEVVVVHAGLVPGQKLESQDPYFVMNMRSIDLGTHLPSDSRDGTVWTKVWNTYQHTVAKQKRSTVIYGHDSKRGLRIEDYSNGIDTGCLKGGRLTALVIEAGHREVKQHLVHVNCKDRSPS